MANTEDKDTSNVAELTEEQLREIVQQNDLAPDTLLERVYHLWRNWADFHIIVVKPTLSIISPSKVILPEKTDDSSELEFVYPIHDAGYKLSASKAEDMFSAGMSMCKMYYTIEKMIYLLIERLKNEGIDQEMEVQVAFDGHQLCQRKAFESIINLPFNVVVTNFDPGLWGEQYLQTVKRLADKGYGYPSEAPRDYFRHSHATPNQPKR
ncbi:virulence factor [Legionella impletisoli]|uniref:Virulence factor n=1 Tax=Legionella impletisoli TaxID=343510 RepID=A0A917JVE2_9GAMM|nr:virulence factor [Legionella impletisoli]GGI88969.1 virulence factor [Legionella impletisoli]